MGEVDIPAGELVHMQYEAPIGELGYLFHQPMADVRIQIAFQNDVFSLLSGISELVEVSFLHLHPWRICLGIARNLGKAIEEAKAAALAWKKISKEADLTVKFMCSAVAASYICGELNCFVGSSEEKEENPRNSNHHSGCKGVWGRPTVVNKRRKPLPLLSDFDDDGS
ncbi:hypothetical protein FQA39_LY19173 [Lamprigera yunnana]|nr:hypothetical protein FQA39_LY19173 [Lamprigera yunnana]